MAIPLAVRGPVAYLLVRALHMGFALWLVAQKPERNWSPFWRCSMSHPAFPQLLDPMQVPREREWATQDPD